MAGKKASPARIAGVQPSQRATYNKLISKGMTPKQAKAFASHAGKRKGGK